MESRTTRVGEHRIQITSDSADVMRFFDRSFPKAPEHPGDAPDISIRIENGCGVPFKDYEVSIGKTCGRVSFRRADYLIECEPDYRHADLYVYDELALKHALLNLYSSFIVYHNWGLLIHSSCVIDNGTGHMFAGRSGAGKSTAAVLSHPRELLADEAAVVKITPEEITVFNSPFRSEQEVTNAEGRCPLASIQFLVQALYNRRTKMGKPNGLLHIMDKVFYWAHSPEETNRILGLLKTLTDRVPMYELHFQKNNTFWELIS